MDTQTLKAQLAADAAAERRHAQRQHWAQVSLLNAAEGNLTYHVPMGADLTSDRRLLAEVWDNAPEMWGAPLAADHVGGRWETVGNGRKAVCLPSC